MQQCGKTYQADTAIHERCGKYRLCHRLYYSYGFDVMTVIPATDNGHFHLFYRRTSLIFFLYLMVEYLTAFLASTTSTLDRSQAALRWLCLQHWQTSGRLVETKFSCHRNCNTVWGQETDTPTDDRSLGCYKFGAYIRRCTEHVLQLGSCSMPNKRHILD